jgi:hypothetical protein
MGDSVKIKRLTNPMFDTDSMTVGEKKIFFSGNTNKGHQSLFSKVYMYDTDLEKTETLYNKTDLSIGRLFVMGSQLFGFASDMKKYGLNQTSNIVRIGRDNLIELKYVPEVSLYSSVIGDTAEGGTGTAVSARGFGGGCSYSGGAGGG